MLNHLEKKKDYSYSVVEIYCRNLQLMENDQLLILHCVAEISLAKDSVNCCDPTYVSMNNNQQYEEPPF